MNVLLQKDYNYMGGSNRFYFICFSNFVWLIHWYFIFWRFLVLFYHLLLVMFHYRFNVMIRRSQILCLNHDIEGRCMIKFYFLLISIFGMHFLKNLILMGYFLQSSMLLYDLLCLFSILIWIYSFLLQTCFSFMWFYLF